MYICMYECVNIIHIHTLCIMNTYAYKNIYVTVWAYVNRCVDESVQVFTFNRIFFLFFLLLFNVALMPAFYIILYSEFCFTKKFFFHVMSICLDTSKIKCVPALRALKVTPLKCINFSNCFLNKEKKKFNFLQYIWECI